LGERFSARDISNMELQGDEFLETKRRESKRGGGVVFHEYGGFTCGGTPSNR